MFEIPEYGSIDTELRLMPSNVILDEGFTLLDTDIDLSGTSPSPTCADAGVSRDACIQLYFVSAPAAPEEVHVASSAPSEPPPASPPTSPPHSDDDDDELTALGFASVPHASAPGVSADAPSSAAAPPQLRRPRPRCWPLQRPPPAPTVATPLCCL